MVNPDSKPHLLDALDTRLAEACERLACRSTASKQVRKWLLEKRAERMGRDDRPAEGAPRADWPRSSTLWTAEVAKHTTADDGTEKLLLQLEGGGRIECVLLRENVGKPRRPGRPGEGLRRTMCISTQVGCAAWAACSAPAGWTASSGT